MKTAHELLKKNWNITEETKFHDYAFLFRSIIKAMEEYADQWKYDFSKECKCTDSPGETWCCNLCGLPTNKHSEKIVGTISLSKVHKLISALEDIKNWDDDLEDEWEDTGYRAIAALKEWQKEPLV